MGCAASSVPCSNGGTPPEQFHTSHFELRTTKFFLYVISCFLFWCLPAQLLRFWVTVSRYLSHDGPNGLITVTRVYLWQQVLSQLMLVRFVLTFFIYIATYHYFRKALRIFIMNILHRMRKFFTVCREQPSTNGIELQRHDMKYEVQQNNAEVRL